MKRALPILLICALAAARPPRALTIAAQSGGVSVSGSQISKAWKAARKKLKRKNGK